MSDFLACARRNPMRPADWMWRRANGIVNGTQPPAGRKRDGKDGFRWIRRAERFIRANQLAVDNASKHRLEATYGPLYWAHEAYQSDTMKARFEIEARILARQGDWDIGFWVGYDEQIVEAYEALFFNVRDKLQHTGYIVHAVLGEAVQRGLSEREYDLLWKMYAYAFGPHMLQTLITKFTNPVWCGTPDNVGSAVQDDTVATMKMKASLAAKTIPVNMATQSDILHIFTKYVEIERMSDSEGRAQHQIMDHIGAMFEAMPINVAGRSVRANNLIIDSPVQQYEHTAVELSYEERMAVAAGHTLPNQKLLEDLRFPPAPAEVEALAGG